MGAAPEGGTGREAGCMGGMLGAPGICPMDTCGGTPACGWEIPAETPGDDRGCWRTAPPPTPAAGAGGALSVTASSLTGGSPVAVRSAGCSSFIDAMARNLGGASQKDRSALRAVRFRLA